jgi:hypothetical protein
LGTTYLLEELVKTLADAKLASPWPVGLSIHPRYMAAPLGDIDFATALERLGLDEVVHMTYVVSRERVLQIVAPILDAHPGLRFGVAQSVEPFLAPEETHAGIGYAEFQERMKALADGLTPPNFTRLPCRTGVPITACRDEGPIPTQRPPRTGGQAGSQDPVRAGQTPPAALALVFHARTRHQSARLSRLYGRLRHAVPGSAG